MQSRNAPSTYLTLEVVVVSKQLRSLLIRYSYVFAYSDLDLGYTDRVKHGMQLTTDTPIKLPYRRIPPAANQEVQEHMQGLLDKTIIRNSCNPWAARSICLKQG